MRKSSQHAPNKGASPTLEEAKAAFKARYEQTRFSLFAIGFMNFLPAETET
jgi:hypothetical protein